jgi:hypothetical protein
MKQLREQEPDTGQSQDRKKKLSSVVSKPKRIKPKSAEETLTSLLSNGSQILDKQTTMMKKNTLENELESGEELTPKKERKPKSLMPVPKLSALESRTLQALKRLKVKPEAFQSLPQITPMLKKSLKGGLRTALEAMRFTTNDEVVADFLKVYDKIPIGDRDRLPWEAIMIKAKVNPIYLLGAIQMAVQTYSWNKSRFLAVSSHPEITKNRIKFAKMAGGVKDREALDIVNGFLQSPRGATVNINQQVATFPGGKSKDGEDVVNSQSVYQGDDVEERLFGGDDILDGKIIKIKQRLLEG